MDQTTELQNRISRLEAVVAVLLTWNSFETDPNIMRDIVRSLSQRGDFARDEFVDLLYRSLRQTEHMPYRFQQLSEQFRKLENQTDYFEHRYSNLLGQFKETSTEADKLLQELKQAGLAPHRGGPTVIEDLKNQQKQQSALGLELHVLYSAYTLGLDLSDLPLPRYLPVRIYLSESNGGRIGKVSATVRRMIEAFGFQIADDLPAETGSWFKRLFVKAKEYSTKPEVAEALAKIERALELKGLNQPQSEVDKKEAEAVSSVITALGPIPNAAMQIGSLLIIKRKDENGDPCVVSRTLSNKEMIYLERNQNLLRSPEEILPSLANYCSSNGLPPSERIQIDGAGQESDK